MIYLAFYHGRADNWWYRFQDWAIRTTSRSAYTHVEFIFAVEPPVLGEAYECFSASGRDGGVRRKVIKLKPEKWDIVAVPWVKSGDVLERILPHLGAKYDYGAIFLTHLLRINVENRTRWMCSELMAMGLGFDRPHVFSPADLFSVVKRVNMLYTDGTAR